MLLCPSDVLLILIFCSLLFGICNKLISNIYPKMRSKSQVHEDIDVRVLPLYNCMLNSK